MSICRECKPTIYEWTDYTVKQSATITSASQYAWYWRLGDLIIGSFAFSLQSAGTASNAITVTLGSLPNPVVADSETAVGSFLFNDASGNERNGVMGWSPSNRYFWFRVDNNSSLFGVAPAVTVANGDVLSGTFQYRKYSWA